MSDPPNAKTLFLARLRADAILVGLVGSTVVDGVPVASIHPDARIGFGTEMPSPAVLLVVQEQNSLDDIVESTPFEVWVYDEPGEAHWRIDKIIHRVRDLIEDWRMGVTLQGVCDSFALDLVSGDFDDDGLKRLVKFVRFRTWLVA